MATNAEQLARLKVYLDPSKTWSDGEVSQLSLLLDFSSQKILNRAYPFGSSPDAVPARYEMLQVQIAAELYGKMGGEGETSHNENGINRAWENADVSKSLLRDITPAVGLVGVVADAVSAS